MGTREDLVKHLWKEVINSNLEPSGVDNAIAVCRRRPNDPFADVGPAIMRMLDAGVSRDDICLLQRAAAYEAVFGTLYALDDPGTDDNDVFMLHEELLTADPTGMEGRPGSAAQWLKSRE